MTTYQQCDGQCHKTSGDHPVAFLIWWRTKKTSFNGLRNRCRYLRNLLRTSQNRNVCESVMANTEKKYWCLTYVFVLNDYWISLTNQIPQVSCWIAQRHNDQKHQNKDKMQVKQKGSQTGNEKHCVSFELNLVRTKSCQSALTINSNITSGGRDMKKSDASGDAHRNMRLWIMMIENVVSSSFSRCCWCLLWLTPKPSWQAQRKGCRLCYHMQKKSPHKPCRADIS